VDPILSYVQTRQAEIISLIRQFVECESPSDDPAAVDRFVDLVADTVSPFAAVKTVLAELDERIARLKAAPTRPECGCAQSTDIGTYDTCAFGCVYCYATNSRAAALSSIRAQFPGSPRLGTRG